MSALTATSLPTGTLPVIDISGLRSAAAADRRLVAERLRDACLDKGFFYISGHGVPAHLAAEIFRQAAPFFALPEAAKLAVRKGTSQRGYQPLREQTLQPGAPPDLK